MFAPAPSGADKPAEAAILAGPDERPKVQGEKPRGSGRARLLLLVTGALSIALLINVAAIFALVISHVIPQLQAWYHLRAARADLERYHNPQAIRHLQACLRVWPEDPEVLLLAARAARRARVYDDAERCLEKYQQVRGIDDAGSFEQQLLSVERGVEDQVVNRCWHLVEQGHPDTPLILEALTRGYLRQYRLVEARACLNRWLESQPDNPQALGLDGQFYLDYKHARTAALESYRRAVQLDPDYDEARMGLAIALLEAKNYAEAAEHLEHLRQGGSDNLRVQVGLADCRYELGEAEEAVKLVESVLAQQPQYAPALGLRGRIALDSGESVAAETWLRQAVTLDPSDHLALYNLILCLNRNGKEAEAQRLQQQLLQMDEDLKRFNDIVTKDMVQRPHDPALHCTLGQLLLRSGHREEGLRWLQNALRQDPNYAPARQALTEYYQKAAGKSDDKVTK